MGKVVLSQCIRNCVPMCDDEASMLHRLEIALEGTCDTRQLGVAASMPPHSKECARSCRSVEAFLQAYRAAAREDVEEAAAGSTGWYAGVEKNEPNRCSAALCAAWIVCVFGT